METYQESKLRPSRRWVFVPLLVAAGLIVTFAGVALYLGVPSAPPTTGATYPWFWWFPFPWFFFIIPVFFLIFFAVRWYFWGGWWWGRGGWYYGGADDPALETLRQRYARGEITQQQFEEMRKELERPQS